MNKRPPNQEPGTRNQEPGRSDHLGYLLTAYLFDNLSPAGKSEVESHLAVCEACRDQLAALQATLGLAEAAFDDDGKTYVFEDRRRQRILEAATLSRFGFFNRASSAIRFRSWKEIAVVAAMLMLVATVTLSMFISAGSKSAMVWDNKPVVTATQLEHGFGSAIEPLSRAGSRGVDEGQDAIVTTINRSGGTDVMELHEQDVRLKSKAPAASDAISGFARTETAVGGAMLESKPTDPNDPRSRTYTWSVQPPAGAAAAPTPVRERMAIPATPAAQPQSADYAMTANVLTVDPGQTVRAPIVRHNFAVTGNSTSTVNGPTVVAGSAAQLESLDYTTSANVLTVEPKTLSGVAPAENSVQERILQDAQKPIAPTTPSSPPPPSSAPVAAFVPKVQTPTSARAPAETATRYTRMSNDKKSDAFPAPTAGATDLRVDAAELEDVAGGGGVNVNPTDGRAATLDDAIGIGGGATPGSGGGWGGGNGTGPGTGVGKGKGSWGERKDDASRRIMVKRYGGSRGEEAKEETSRPAESKPTEYGLFPTGGGPGPAVATEGRAKPSAKLQPGKDTLAAGVPEFDQNNVPAKPDGTTLNRGLNESKGDVAGLPLQQAAQNGEVKQYREEMEKMHGLVRGITIQQQQAVVVEGKEAERDLSRQNLLNTLGDEDQEAAASGAKQEAEKRLSQLSAGQGLERPLSANNDKLADMFQRVEESVRGRQEQLVRERAGEEIDELESRSKVAIAAKDDTIRRQEELLAKERANQEELHRANAALTAQNDQLAAQKAAQVGEELKEDYEIEYSKKRALVKNATPREPAIMGDRLADGTSAKDVKDVASPVDNALETELTDMESAGERNPAKRNSGSKRTEVITRGYTQTRDDVVIKQMELSAGDKVDTSKLKAGLAAAAVVVPADVLDKAELGDHFETVNPHKPNNQSAFGNPDAKMFHITKSDEDAPVELGRRPQSEVVNKSSLLSTISDDEITTKRDQISHHRRDRAALEALAGRERESDQFKARVGKMVEQVKDLNARGEHQAAANMATQVLKIDPLNAEAEGLKNKSRGFAHSGERKDVAPSQYREALLDVNEASVSSGPLIVYPPNWDEISKREPQTATASGTTSTLDGATAAGRYKSTLSNPVKLNAKLDSEQEKLVSSFDGDVDKLTGSDTSGAVLFDPQAKRETAAGTGQKVSNDSLYREYPKNGKAPASNPVAAGRGASLEDVEVSFQGLDPEVLQGDFGDIRRLGAPTGLVQPRIPGDTTYFGFVTPNADGKVAPPGISGGDNTLNYFDVDYDAAAAQNTKKDVSAVELKIADVRDLTSAVQDFPGPDLGTSGKPAPITLLRPRLDPNFPSRGEANNSKTPADELVKIIKDRFAADFTDPSTAIEESGGKLVVLNTPDVQQKVDGYLSELRKSAAELKSVPTSAQNAPAVAQTVPTDTPTGTGLQNAPAGFRRQWYSKAFGSPVLTQGQSQQLIRLNPLSSPLGASITQLKSDERTLRAYNVLRAEAGTGTGKALSFAEFCKRPAPIAPPVLTDDGLDEDAYIEKHGTRPFVDAKRDHLSTFSMDVDTASYTRARSQLRENNLPDPAAVRVEEFVNYFKQPYSVAGEEAFGVFAEAAPSPFNRGGGVPPSVASKSASSPIVADASPLQLLKIGIKSRDPKPGERKPAMLTFAVDTSGSMTRDDRLDMLRAALGALVEQLQPEDAVSIVAFADQAQVLLPRTQARQKQRILDAVAALHPDGGTNVEAGLALAYRIADESFSPDAVNRVILCSDGVANVGAKGPEAVLKTVKVFAGRGIDLSSVGFGMGKYNDEMMVRLADNGNGSCHFVDTLDEARRIFTQQLPPNLSALARDAKIQVEFNPTVVARYRLLGYEKRKIADKDFRNDAIDAGEVQHSTLVTALYEIERAPAARGPLGKVFLRWKDAGHRHLPVIERNFPLDESMQAASAESASPQLRFLACVARFAELLRNSPWTRNSSFADVLEQLDQLPAEFKQREDCKEVRELVQRAQTLSIQQWSKDL